MPVHICQSGALDETTLPMLNKKDQMQSSPHPWEMTFSSSCRLLWSFLGSSLDILLAWEMDAWRSGRTNGPLESAYHLRGASPTHLDQDQVTDPGRTPCRVKEVVQMGAGHIQVENAVPFKRPLSGLCCRWRLGQLRGGGRVVGPLWREGAGSRQAHRCLCLPSEVALKECRRQISVSGGSSLTVGARD